ncbi:MAG: AsmA-like C-terminal region-containing protein [Candidatus Eiseniibacteriota bacterium]
MSEPTAARPRAPRGWLIAAGVVAALGVLAWVALQVWLPPARVLAIARQQLAASLHREVSLDGASVSIWPPVRARLRGLSIGEPGGLKQGAALKLESLDLDLDPLALLVRRIVLRRVTLVHPRLHLVLLAAGGTNFDSQPPAAGGAPPGAAAMPFDIAIQSLRIQNGELLMDDVRASRRTALDLDMRVSLSLAGGSRIATLGSTRLSGFASGPLTATRRADLDQRLASLTLEIEHRGTFDAAHQRLALERLAIRLGSAEIAFRGVIDGVGGPQPLARLEAHTDGLDFGALIDAAAAADLPALRGLTGSGRVSFDLTVNGAISPGRLPEIAGQVTVRDAAFRYPKAPVGVRDLSFDARLSPDSLNLTNLTARLADQPLHGSLRLAHFQDPAVEFHLTGAMDLAAIGPLIAPASTSLGGRATLDVSGSGRVRAPGEFALAGNATLEEVRVASPQLPQPMQHVSGTVEFANTHAAVHALRGAAGRSSFTLEASVERPMALSAKPGGAAPAQVNFTLDSPYLDLDELLPPTPGPTLLPNAAGSGRVRIGRLRHQQLDVENVDARVTFDPTTFTVSQFALEGYGGRVGGNAKFDLRDPAHPGFAVGARVDSVQADALLSAWTPAKGLMRGALNTTLDLSGTGTQPQELARSLTAVGLAAMSSGELGPTPALAAIAKLTGVPAFEKMSFRDLHLPFEVRDGKLTTRDVTIHSQTGDWTASGKVGFDGALDYTVGAMIPADQVAKLGEGGMRAIGALADKSGRLHLKFRVGGTARNPSVGIDASALEGQLKGALGAEGEKLGQQLGQALSPSAGGDSARDHQMQALADSLKKIKGRDLLKSLFGSPRAPADTARR